MKKIFVITLFLLSSILNSHLFAKTCEDGIVIETPTKEFCLSNTTMNWWSAFTWCASQGRQLATVHEACDTSTKKWNGAIGSGACQNLNNAKYSSNYFWTAIPHQDSLAYYIQPSSGLLDNSYLRTTYYRALCW